MLLVVLADTVSYILALVTLITTKSVDDDNSLDDDASNRLLSMKLNLCDLPPIFK